MTLIETPTHIALSAEDAEAITQAALDYAFGGYLGDAERMERCLHPHLAKRAIFPDARHAEKSSLHQLTALDLVKAARQGSFNQPENRRQADVRLLDCFGNIAMVRLEMNDWVDYMQIGKFNGQWVIINVLWELKEQG